MPPLLLIPAYSWACLGTPFALPYSYEASFTAMKEGLYAIKWPDAETAFRLLFSPYIRCYGYGPAPEPYRGIWGAPVMLERWSADSYRRYVERTVQVGGIPTLNLTDRRINLEADLVRLTLESARAFQIA